MPGRAIARRNFHVRLVMGLTAFALLGLVILYVRLAIVSFHGRGAMDGWGDLAMIACYALIIVGAFLIRIINSDDPESANLPPRPHDVDPLADHSPSDRA